MANLQFLKTQPHLFKLATEAHTCLIQENHRFVAINCRCMAELIVKDMAGNKRVCYENLADRIDHLQIEEIWKEKLHIIRKIGNKAAHNVAVSHSEALATFDAMYQVCKWRYALQPAKPAAKNYGSHIAVGLLSAAFAALTTVKVVNYLDTQKHKS